MQLHSKVLIYEHNLHFSLVKEGETNSRINNTKLLMHNARNTTT